MQRVGKFILIIVLLLAVGGTFLYLRKSEKIFAGTPGETVELIFELDKKFEFGEYYFDLDNGQGSTYPLCYCLSEKNTYPPDCFGDIKYIYNNMPGKDCIPLNIGTGSCSVKGTNTSGHATMFLIPLEYQWTKPVEKIVIGVKVPNQAPDGAKIVVKVTIFKRNDFGKLIIYRQYEQSIVARHSIK